MSIHFTLLSYYYTVTSAKSKVLEASAVIIIRVPVLLMQKVALNLTFY